MRRFLLFTITLLLMSAVLDSPSVRTQETETGLPDSSEFTEAGSGCDNKVNLTPGVTVPAVDWPNTFRCELKIHTCDGMKTYRSEVRKAGPNLCADYWAKLKELEAREICCDKDIRCKNPPSSAPLPPWLDPRSCRESVGVGPALTSQRVDDQNRLLPPGQVWCVAVYSICRGGIHTPNLIPVIKKVTIDVAMWHNNYIEAVDSACQSFFDEHRSAPNRSVCCDTWEDASDNPAAGPCDPISDPDCDGIPNYQDAFPFHARVREYTSDSPRTRFPFWKDLENAVPSEYCDCQWELIDTRYKCSNVRVHNSAGRGSSNQAKYKYQAKWKCPSNDRQIITTREVTMPGLYCPR